MIRGYQSNRKVGPAALDATVADFLADPATLPPFDLLRADLVAAIAITAHWAPARQRAAVQKRYCLHLARLAATLVEAVEAAAANAVRARRSA